MGDRWTYFITWSTYGSWLPGDARGWRKRQNGEQRPRPFLADWCREQMRYEAVLLSENDRRTIHNACQEHCDYRGWVLLAVHARTNHVHAVVIANAAPRVVRNQFKANCTRSLRTQEIPLDAKQPWVKGGDIEVLDTDDDVENCVQYVLDAQ
jgi:REP element-mobilizing transposase RayT